MENPILNAALPAVLVHGGVFLVAGVLPVFAFYILDGIVHLVRGRGIAALLIAVGMVIALAVGGAYAWHAGLGQLVGTPAYGPTQAGADGNAALFVGWAIALGAIGFLFRMVNLATGRRKRR